MVAQPSLSYTQVLTWVDNLVPAFTKSQRIALALLTTCILIAHSLVLAELAGAFPPSFAARFRSGHTAHKHMLKRVGRLLGNKALASQRLIAVLARLSIALALQTAQRGYYPGLRAPDGRHLLPILVDYTEVEDRFVIGWLPESQRRPLHKKLVRMLAKMGAPRLHAPLIAKFAWLPLMDGLIYTSDYLRRLLARRLLRPRRGWVVRYGIEPEWYEETPSPTPTCDVLFLGDATWERGFHVLLSAIPIVLAAMPSAKFRLLVRRWNHKVRLTIDKPATARHSHARPARLPTDRCCVKDGVRTQVWKSDSIKEGANTMFPG